MRVLLIEDDEDDYLLVRDMLSEHTPHRYDLQWISEYGAALGALDRGAHDVCLLDYRLGSQSGITLLQEALARGCRIPIIVLTGLGDYEVDLQAMHAGAADYLVKGQINTPLLERSIRYAVERKRHQLALQQSEEKYRELVEHADTIIIRIDAQGRILFLNEFACSFFGYAEEEVVGRPVVGTILSKTDSQGHDLTAMMQEILSAPERYPRNENENICRDGRRVWVSWSNRAIRDDAGHLVGMLCVGHDLTAQKRAEEALRESEERFRGMFEKTLAIKMLIDPLSGLIVDANPAACRFYGYPLQTLKGMRISEVNVLNAGEVLKEMARALQERRNHFFFKHRQACGSVRDVEVHSSPIEFGGQRLLYSIIYDITSLKRAEEALKESEAKHRMIFEYSPLGIVHFDQNGTITACNEPLVKILSAPVEKLVGFNLLDSLQNTEMRQAVAACLSGQRGRYEGCYRSVTSGASAVIRADFNPILPGDGEAPGGVGIIEDISERKQAEEALRESERQLRCLSSKLLSAQEEERKRIARELHDSIGSSLSAIKIGIESVCKHQAQAAAAQPVETLIALVQAAIEESRRIMTDLRPAILDDLGLITTISWLRRQFQTIYPHIHVETQIRLEEEEIPPALKIVMFRILQEAFHNIAKYSRAELVSLALSKDHGHLQLTIEDNGTGFDIPSVCSRRELEGGLGLDSMRERAELSGGTFSLHSTLGVGTLIRVVWPAK